MLLRNDLLHYTHPSPRTVRILWIAPEQSHAYVFDVAARSADVELVQLSLLHADIRAGRASVLPADPYLMVVSQDLLPAKHLQLRAGVPPALPAVSADLGMIERVLTNLLDNAIRHTPAGGTVEIDLASQDGKVAVTVSDTGPGIPPALRESIFQRPFPSGGAHRGGGLGLLIVQRMLQLNGSQVKLVDRQGGTTLTFALRAAGR